jgi:hypothetical protein
MNLSINLSISIYLSIYVSIYLSIYLWLHYGYKTLVINFHIHGLSRDAARLPWLPREPGQCAGILHRLGRGVDCGVGEGFEKMTSSKERNTIPHVFQHVFFVLCCFKIWCGNKHLEQKHLFRETMPNMCFFLGGCSTLFNGSTDKTHDFDKQKHWKNPIFTKLSFVGNRPNMWELAKKSTTRN